MLCAMAVTTHADALPTESRESAPTSADAAPRVAAVPATGEPRYVTSGGTPDWMGEIWRKYFTRLKDYFLQAFTLLVRPGRFMEEWATGQREALNPLRFLGLGFLLIITARHLGERYLLGPALEAQNLTSVLRSPLGVELVFLTLALPTHAVMRLSGSRATFSATLAAFIFTFMGPVVLLQVGAWLISGLFMLLTGSLPLFELKAGFAARLYRHSAYPWPIMVANWVALIYCVRAIAGVHRKRWGWAFLALFVAHLVFVPLLSQLTKVEVQDVTQLLDRAGKWLGPG